MALLCINTCDPVCSVLLRTVKGDTINERPLRTGHDRALAVMVLDIIAKAGITPVDLNRIAVATGPGSFTGSRIGVAFARGLALCGPVDIVGLHLLQVLAIAAQAQGTAIGVSVRKVGRGQVAWCAWDGRNWLQTPTPGQPETLLSAIEYTCTGRSRTIVGDPIDLVPEINPMLNTDMHEFADQAERLDPTHNPALPWYARPPDAKLPGGLDPWA